MLHGQLCTKKHYRQSLPYRITRSIKAEHSGYQNYNYNYIPKQSATIENPKNQCCNIL